MSIVNMMHTVMNNITHHQVGNAPVPRKSNSPGRLVYVIIFSIKYVVRI